jgi:hypothetical protein
MILLRSFLLIILCSCSTPKVEQVTTLSITELAPDKRSHITTQHLVHLSKIYDIEPYLYSKKVQVQTGVLAKHYPVITLNTRFAEDPEKLLAAFLHEEFHWWLIQNPKKAKAVLKRVKITYPKIKDHVHLIVCYLDYLAIKHLLGDKSATRIFQDFIYKDRIFPWYYQQAIYKDLVIKKALLDFKLMPQGLN